MKINVHKNPKNTSLNSLSLKTLIIRSNNLLVFNEDFRPIIEKVHRIDLGLTQVGRNFVCKKDIMVL